MKPLKNLSKNIDHRCSIRQKRRKEHGFNKSINNEYDNTSMGILLNDICHRTDMLGNSKGNRTDDL